MSGVFDESLVNGDFEPLVTSQAAWYDEDMADNVVPSSTGVGATTSSAQVSAAAGLVYVSAVGATSSSAQTSAAAGDVAIPGVATTAASAQTSAGVGAIAVASVGATSAAAQTTAAVGTVSVDAVGASSSTPQTDAAAGAVAINGTAATASSPQVSAAIGDVDTTSTGIGATTATPQLDAATATAYVFAAGASSASAQSSAASGVIDTLAAGATTATEQTDAAAAAVAVRGSAATASSPQVTAATGQVHPESSTGAGATTATPQTDTATGAIVLEGAASTVSSAQIGTATGVLGPPPMLYCASSRRENRMNIFVQIPVPAANGSGAAVDMNTFGSTKTVSVAGPFTASVTIEYTNESVPTTWAPLYTFNNPDGFTFEVACRWMRATVTDYKAGTPRCDVGGSDDGCMFESLPVTASNGVGAAVDVSQLGLFKTVTVGGPYRGNVQIEISEDGSTAWSQIGFGFPNPGGQSAIVAAHWMRVVRAGVPLINPGLPIVNVGGVNAGIPPSLGPGAILAWGNDNVGSAADTRYLSPGHDFSIASLTDTMKVPTPYGGTLLHLFVRHNSAGGNGASIVYTVMVNGIDSGISLTLPTGAIGQGSNLVDSAVFAQGAQISLRATKALSVGSGDIDVEASLKVV